MKLTVVILTKNEEVNIAKAIKSVIDNVEDVIVLDSYSSDNTPEIAAQLSAKVFFKTFSSFGEQRRYALNELPIATDWVLFLDADETVDEYFLKEANEIVGNPQFDAYECKYKFIFLKKWIKYGGYYGTRITRLFNRHKVAISRDMNEHVKINGAVGLMENDILHEDYKGLDDWLIKHIKYADFEAMELIKNQDKEFASLFGNQAQRKRWVRINIWNKILPPLIRPFIYFFYRYFIKLGFMDGFRGAIFHFLHAFWYYFLIDVKFLMAKKGWNSVRD